MSLAMTKGEREAFLADVHVGIISISDGARGPLARKFHHGAELGCRRLSGG